MPVTKEIARRNGAKGGRPSQAKTRLKASSKIINQLIEQQEAPLDVMFDNMLFWFRQSKKTTAKLETLLESAKPDDAKRDEAIKLLRSMLAARERAQQCAVDAAPYVHPRLAAVEHKASGEIKMIISSDDEKL